MTHITTEMLKACGIPENAVADTNYTPWAVESRCRELVEKNLHAPFDMTAPAHVPTGTFDKGVFYDVLNGYIMRDVNPVLGPVNVQQMRDFGWSESLIQLAVKHFGSTDGVKPEPSPLAEYERQLLLNLD
ncbi:MAG TPA: hypothetical protein PLO23_08055 [Alphaproteobacteria bacterium]|nr:hypothetical protein [Alphaproteobacteria bacterium]